MAGENYHTTLLTHARITLEIDNNAEHDFVTVTIFAKQKEDKYAGVVIGEDLESTYEKGRERLRNVVGMNYIAPTVAAEAKQEETVEYSANRQYFIANQYFGTNRYWVNRQQLSNFQGNERRVNVNSNTVLGVRNAPNGPYYSSAELLTKHSACVKTVGRNTGLESGTIVELAMPIAPIRGYNDQSDVHSGTREMVEIIRWRVEECPGCRRRSFERFSERVEADIRAKTCPQVGEGTDHMISYHITEIMRCTHINCGWQASTRLPDELKAVCRALDDSAFMNMEYEVRPGPTILDGIDIHADYQFWMHKGDMHDYLRSLGVYQN
jgi:hypothetical protein